MGAVLINRDVADFVDDQQLGQTIVLEALLPSMLGLGLGQRGDEPHRGGGPRPIPRLDRFQAQGDRPRGRPPCLAGPRRPHSPRAR